VKNASWRRSRNGLRKQIRAQAVRLRVGRLRPDSPREATPTRCLKAGRPSAAPAHSRARNPGVAGGPVGVSTTPPKAKALLRAAMTFPVGEATPRRGGPGEGQLHVRRGRRPLFAVANRVRGNGGASYGVPTVYTASTRPASRFMMFALTHPKNMDKVDTISPEVQDKQYSVRASPSLTELNDAPKGYTRGRHEEVCEQADRSWRRRWWTI